MDGCTRWVTKEFRSENAGFGYENPAGFVSSQWPINPRLFVLYRILVAIAVTGWCIADVAYESSEFYEGKVWKWFIFATNWSFMLLTLSTMYQALTSILYTCREYWIVDPLYSRSMPLCLKLQWIIYNLSCNSAVVVTLSYWFFIALFDHSPLLQAPMSRLKHTMNTVYIIVDVIISGMPMRVLHMFITITLGSVYALFNALYFLNNGTVATGYNGEEKHHYAYSFMNWRKPIEAVITCVLCVMLAIISQVILHILYKLRVCIYSRFYFNSSDTHESELQNIISNSTSYNALDEKSLDSNDSRLIE